ncbi:hypothetical protein ScPMuIL_013980 [Solemya velum]
MKKTHGRQTTLFHSWGNKKSTTNYQQSTSTSRNQTAVSDDIIDLCDLEDDEALLAKAVDETLAETHNVGSSVNNAVFNLSLGAEDIGSTLLPSQDLSAIPDLPGFDKCAGKLWIYPTNYPVREYQFHIVEQALFKNTMVTLPTGLGKTFIAAVVMYNFYRWYPQGKVVFMAPTKPLVAQQIEACYNIMGIPQKDTAEMTGNMFPTERLKAWQQKRMFFLTPQVVVNDLSRGTCPAVDIKCLVVDEAHKALGNHAYCQVVRELVKYSRDFRVLSLSATPGSDIKAVQQVLENLLISHIELRTEESPDIKRYSFERKVDKVVVPLGDELLMVKNKYLQVMDVVMDRLRRLGVIYKRDTKSLSKFLILKAREAFRQNPPERLQRSQFGLVEGDFALAMSLFHGFELLQQHGLRSLYEYLNDKNYGKNRTELTRNGTYNELMTKLQEKFSGQNNSAVQGQMDNKHFATGHPKLGKLDEIVLEHFQKFQNVAAEAGTATRVMIFSQYRNSVIEITNMLKQHNPIVKVMNFIGQSSAGKASKGFTQKEQLEVMKKFRDGGYNTLVSTCVGEEGLDIGEVDLIICFDALKSPIRLVQRMGRTGRKREGRIVMLVTEGKEEQIYNQSQYSKRSIHKAILNSSNSLHFYQHNPRMVPNGLVPNCHKMYITVKDDFKADKKKTTTSTKPLKNLPKTVNIRDKKPAVSDDIITEDEYMDLKDNWFVPESQIPLMPMHSFHCLPNGKKTGPVDTVDRRVLSLTEWIPWQNRLQSSHQIDHSLKSQHFVELMEFAELNQSLDPSEDNYGLEMQAYLNDDDILKPGEMDTISDGKITTFCVPVSNVPKKVSDKREKELVSVRDRKSTAKYKNAFHRAKTKSKLLPDFELGPELIDSDEDLPVVNIGTVHNAGGNLHMSTKHLADVVHLETTVDENISSKNDAACEYLHVQSKITMNNIEDERDQFDGVKKEKRHNRKKRKSGNNKTFVELIADNDQSDFLEDNKNHSESFVENRVQLVDHKNDQSLDSTEYSQDCEERMNIVADIHTGKEKDEHFTPSQVFTLKNSNRNMKSENEDNFHSMYRVKTPPPIEEVDEIFEAMKNLERLPKLDLYKIVEQWECGNRYTELKITSSSKTTPQKIFIPFQDIFLTKTSSRPVSELSNTTMQPRTPKLNATADNDKSSLPASELSNTTMQSRTPKLSATADNDKSLCDLFGSSFTSHSGNGETPLCGTSSKSNKRLLFEGNNLCKEKNNSFTLLKKQESSNVKSSNCQTKSERDRAEHSLLKNAKGNNSPQQDARNEKKTVEKQKTEITKNLVFEDEFFDNEFCDPEKEHNEKENDELSDHEFTDPGKEQPYESKQKNSDGPDTVDEFTENSLFEDEFSDNEMVDAVAELETPFKNNGSTQFTFTQALDCVHSSSEQSSNESFLEGTSKAEKESISTYDRGDICVDQRKTHISNETIGNIKDIGKKFSSESLYQEREHSKRELDMKRANMLDKTLSVDSLGNRISSVEVAKLGDIDLLDDIEHTILSDSDDDIDIPKFDLGYSIDDDIIPPSPNASQSFSQKSFSGRIGQLFSSCRRSSISLFKGQSSKSLCEIQESVNFKSMKETTGKNEEVSNQMKLPAIDENKSSSNSGIEIGENRICGWMTGSNKKCPMSNDKQQRDKNESKAYSVAPLAVLNEVSELSEWDTDEELVKETTNFDLGWDENLGNGSDEDFLEYSDQNLSKSIQLPETKSVAVSLAGKSSIRKLFSPKPEMQEATLTPPSTRSSFNNSPDLDDSLIVRRKRKVAVIESPCSQVSIHSTIHQCTMDDNNPSPSRQQFKTPVKPAGKPRNKKARLSSFSLDNTDSDDVSVSKKKEVSFLLDASSDDDDFVCDRRTINCGLVKKDIPKSKTKKKKKRSCDFIEDEADLTDNGDTISSDESDHSDLDRYDASMINDMTQFSQEPADMHAVYLKSVRSPISIPNRFKLQYRHRDIDVFSQPPQEEDESQYMEDSFCVDDDFEDSEGTSHEDTDFDLTSPVRCKRKPKRTLKKVPAGLKRVRQIQESSSEDEHGNVPNFDISIAEECCNKSVSYGGKIVSSSEDEIVDKCQKQTTKILQNSQLSHAHGHNSELSIIKQREERLKKQHEKQKEFRMSLAENRKRTMPCHTERRFSDQEDSVPKSPLVKNLDQETFASVGNSLDNSEKLIVFVDSRELSGAQEVVSSLRFEHKVNVSTAQLSGCDYIVSNRMAVERMHWSEFSNGSNRKKTIEHIQHLCDLYERPCLIIEKDRVKPGDGKGGNLTHWTQYVERTLTLLAKSNVKVYFTESQVETANMIAELCGLERRKSHSISVPIELSPQKAKHLKFYLSIPRISYIHALNLCHNFQNLSEFLHSLVPTIQRKGDMERARAKDVHTYLRHEFDPQMLPTGIG